MQTKRDVEGKNTKKVDNVEKRKYEFRLKSHKRISAEKYRDNLSEPFSETP